MHLRLGKNKLHRRQLTRITMSNLVFVALLRKKTHLLLGPKNNTRENKEEQERKTPTEYIRKMKIAIFKKNALLCVTTEVRS
mmetsp:Transcript_15455/g.21826  ORF Transcript_15455/g.21826 Transcript_15455/m.21826 type:complete len:82 (+) Transcript_15455:569-814(+)